MNGLILMFGEKFQCIYYKKFCQQLFLELNTIRLKIEKNATEKMVRYIL